MNNAHDAIPICFPVAVTDSCLSRLFVNSNEMNHLDQNSLQIHCSLQEYECWRIIQSRYTLCMNKSYQDLFRIRCPKRRNTSSLHLSLENTRYMNISENGLVAIRYQLQSTASLLIRSLTNIGLMNRPYPW